MSVKYMPGPTSSSSVWHANVQNMEHCPHPIQDPQEKHRSTSCKNWDSEMVPTTSALLFMMRFSLGSLAGRTAALFGLESSLI